MNHDFQTEYAKKTGRWSLQRQLTSTTMVEGERAAIRDRRRRQLDGCSMCRRRDLARSVRGGRFPAAREHLDDPLGTATRSSTPSHFVPSSGFRGVVAFSGSYNLVEGDRRRPRIRGPPASEANLPQDVRNMAPRGGAPASFDHRHRFVGNVTWALPQRGGAFGSNWRVTAIVSLQSGAPFTVNLGTDRAKHRLWTSAAAGRQRRCQRRRRRKLHPVVQHRGVFLCRRPSPSAMPDAIPCSGQAYADVDASVQKDIVLARGTRLELRWEMFNLFNHVNFDVPNRVFGTSNFGRIFSAQAGAPDAVRPQVRVLMPAMGATRSAVAPDARGLLHAGNADVTLIATPAGAEEDHDEVPTADVCSTRTGKSRLWKP